MQLGSLADVHFVQSVQEAQVVLDPCQENEQVYVFHQVVQHVADFLDEPSSSQRLTV